MHVIKVLKATPAFAVVLVFSSVAVADSGKQNQQSSEDPTELVCRTVYETGSRLRKNRVCMTRAQWADQKRQDRMLIEQSQMRACTPGANC
jgi:hypothetical protein